MRKSKLIHRVTLCLSLLSLSVNAARSQEFSGSVSLATDYMFRGVSQTLSGPALQGELNFSHGSGVYGFVWGSNVDFTDDPTQADGAAFEFNYGAGVSFPLMANLELDIGASVYVYPNLNPSFDYDYVEWHSRVSLDQKYSATLTYTNNVFGTGFVGKALELETRLATLFEHLSLDLLVGHVDLTDGHDMTYQYGEVGLSRRKGNTLVDLAYCFTRGANDQMFVSSTTSDRWVLSLSYQF